MFSWLGKLVPVFWLMELDLISLKGSTVAVVGSVYIWTVLLALAVLDASNFCSRVKVALSAYLHSHQPPTCPLNLCYCFCPPVLPCIARWILLGMGLCGSILSSLTLASATWRLVWASLNALSSPSVSWSLFALVSPRQACPLSRRVCVFFQFPGPALCAAWLVYTAGVYVCLFLGPTGLLSALWGSPGLQWFVHWASLGTPGPPSMPWGFCGLLSVPWACHLVRATVCELFMDWEVQLSLFSALLVPALPGFLRFCSTPLGLPMRELPSARELVRLQNSLPLSEHELLSRSSPCLPILCLHPLSYLVSGSLDCLPWRPGFFCSLLEFAL